MYVVEPLKSVATTKGVEQVGFGGGKWSQEEIYKKNPPQGHKSGEPTQ